MHYFQISQFMRKTLETDHRTALIAKKGACVAGRKGRVVGAAAPPPCNIRGENQSTH